MSGNVKEVRDSGFVEAIRTGIVLEDFWAPRCGPCRTQVADVQPLGLDNCDERT